MSAAFASWSARLRASLVLLLLAAGATSAAAASDVVVVVGSQSPITRLSKEELADVFLGRMTRLPDGSRLVPLDLGEGSPLREALYVDLARMTPAQLKAHWSKLIFTGRGRPPRSLDQDEEVLRVVRGNPMAIGYIDRRFADTTVRILHP